MLRDPASRSRRCTSCRRPDARRRAGGGVSLRVGAPLAGVEIWAARKRWQPGRPRDAAAASACRSTRASRSRRSVALAGAPAPSARRRPLAAIELSPPRGQRRSSVAAISLRTPRLATGPSSRGTVAAPRRCELARRRHAGLVCASCRQARRASSRVRRRSRLEPRRRRTLARRARDQAVAGDGLGDRAAPLRRRRELRLAARPPPRRRACTLRSTLESART